MKRMKMQKGITLIALIVTIIILIIIAMIAIATLRDRGIIGYAQNAASDYNKEKDKEQSKLSEFESIIEEKINDNKEINKNEDVPVPEGFKIVAGTKDEGLVIEHETEKSQFVWIPVPNIKTFAKLQKDSTENYEGVLYDFVGNSITEMKNYGVDNKSQYREPDIVTQIHLVQEHTRIDGADKDLENLKQAGITTDLTGDNKVNEEDLKAQMQSDFNKMVASVAKYKGFYVGRYETSLNGTQVQSKAGQTPMNNVTWYETYKNSKTYLQNGVVSEMIWGCQWDAMMKFIGIERALARGYVSQKKINFTTVPYKTGGTDYSTNYTLKEGDANYISYRDVVKNIYDLEGNVGEFTQEALSTNIRISRGGQIHVNATGTPANRGYIIPMNSSETQGSRLALYIE